jgi:uncharacterized membrane protein YccC
MSGIAPSAGHPLLQPNLTTNARRFDIGAGPIAHLPMIFAAKTTASGLISLLIAFTFNLDQPQWALLTVFIVSQPQSGLVLGKSFYRIIGTLVGAVVALLLVALFAQERVLFLGVLALWIGVCTFGSQYARNFAAYSFVLSGYTAAIVGIPAALEANNAFYTATARVTEICLGIIVAAAVNRIVLPSSLAATLWQSVAAGRQALIDYLAEMPEDGRAAKSAAPLVSKAIAIENQRASAISEDREVRDRSSSLRLLNLALLRAVAAAQSLGDHLAYLRHAGRPVEASINDAVSGASQLLKLWQTGAINASGLHQKLREAEARGSLARLLFPVSSSDDVAPRQAAAIASLRELFAALTAYVEAYETCVSSKTPVPGRIPFSPANDPITALWTGLRASLAVVLVGWFWILSAWPHGSTAVILAAVATARLATMGHAVVLAVAATLIFSLATIPAFVIVDVLLPLASGFPMFALIVGPMLFCCAFLMSKPNPKKALVGFLSALLFASVGQFQNRMVYDPVGLLNTSIAAVFAALVLWAVIAPETAAAARRRFLRIARQAVSRLTAPRHPIGVVEFETRIAEGLDQLQGHLHADQPTDIAALQAGMRLLGAGQALRRREEEGAAPTIAFGNSSTSDDYVADLLKRGHAQLSAEPDDQVHRDAA